MRITVRLDPIQAIWVDAIADLHETTRAAVVREALGHLAARESVRVRRTRHYALLREVARLEAWDPVTDYLAGKRRG